MEMKINGKDDGEMELADAGGEFTNGVAEQAKAPSETVTTLGSGPNLDSILRIPVQLQVVLGSATMPVANLMKLGRGAIVPLDHRVGEPVDVVVNGRIIARGEVVVVEDDNSRFGISLTEIVGRTGHGTGSLTRARTHGTPPLRSRSQPRASRAATGSPPCSWSWASRWRPG